MILGEKRIQLHHIKMKLFRPAARGVLEANPLNKYHNCIQRGTGGSVLHRSQTSPWCD